MIDPASRFYTILSDIHDTLQSRPYCRKLALLPPASYHVTIFSTADDRHREPPLWPAGLATAAAMAACHDYVEERLQGFSLNCTLPFRFRVADCNPGEMQRTLRLEMEPVDQAENRKLRQLRDRLASATGIRSPMHKQYRFHLSLAYVIDWLDRGEEFRLREDYGEWKHLLQAAMPVIEFGQPAYCTFETMLRYDRRRIVGEIPVL